jgi:Leucine-rich repeat (LRR) protein
MSNNKFTIKNTIKISLCLQNSTLEVLDIRLCDIGEAGMSAIGTALVRSKLRFLKAACNQCGDPAAKAIALALGEPLTKLEKLDLSNNGVSDSAGRVFAVSLASNKLLRKLDLSENELSSETGELLSSSLRLNSTLVSLNLEENPRM